MTEEKRYTASMDHAPLRRWLKFLGAALAAMGATACSEMNERLSADPAFHGDDGRFVQPRVDEKGDPLLVDYSYAGYRFGEEAVPDVEGPVFDVTDFGASPDDGNDDTDGVQRAIDAATEAGGGVVFFPPGVFHFHTPLGEKEPLVIESSHIVLRGSGAGVGGTILFQVNAEGGWLVQFRSPDDGFPFGSGLARVVEDAPRNSRELVVDDGSRLEPGQWIALWAENPRAVADRFMRSRPIPEDWTRIRENGVPLREINRIESVDGNRVTLKAPIHLAHLEAFDIRLRPFEPIEEVGVEDIAFMGNWLGHFLHHRSRYDDYHFNALRFMRVTDAWVRRCSFINLNQTLSVDTTANMTIKHTRIAGTGPHSGPTQNRSTRNLVALSSDESDGAWHNLQWRAQTAGAVFWRVDMHPVMPIDVHGMYAYSSLLDAVNGGYLMDSGGPVASFPQHGPGFVLWNFSYLHGATEAQRRNSSRAQTIGPWGTRPWIVDPIAVGLHGAAEEIGVDEDVFLVMDSLGEPVQPESLYEAQLQQRLGRLPAWVGEARESWEAFREMPLPEFFYPLRENNPVTHNFPQEIPLDFLAEDLQGIKQMRRHPNDFEVEPPPDGTFRTDFMKLKTVVHNVLSYVHSFSVPFGSTTLYAQPGGPGSVTIEKSERDGRRALTLRVTYPHEEPEGYYERYPRERHVRGKYLGDNKAEEWDAAEEMVRALGGTIERRNTGGGAEVRITVPEMNGR